MKIHNRVAIGLIAGVFLGAVWGPGASVLEPMGTIFIKLIRMIIVPLVASSLITAIAGLPGKAVLGRMGLKASGFILVSLFVALVIGVIAGHSLRPGDGLSQDARMSLLSKVSAPEIDTNVSRTSFVEMLAQLIPDNPIRAAAEGNVLQILLVSILVGLAASMLPDSRRKPLTDLTQSVVDILFKITGWILELAPFGIFGLMAAIVGQSGLAVLWSLSTYVGVVILALIIHVFLVYGVVLCFVARVKLVKFVESLKPSVLIVFATCSTAAALPVSMAKMQTIMGLPSKVVSFVLPLGAAIGRDGSGIYQAISVMFIAQVYSIDLGGQALVTFVVAAMLSSIAVASVPAGSFVNLAIILSALGIPLEGAALVFGVERPLDMVRSSVNLLGHFVNASWVGADKSVD